MAVDTTKDGNDILILSDNFQETGNLHNRHLQDLVQACIVTGRTLTIISITAPQKDKWHKGQYRHIGLGAKIGADSTAFQKIRASLLLRLTLAKLPRHKLVILDAVSYPHMFMMGKWAEKKRIPQIFWAHKIYPEVLLYEKGLCADKANPPKPHKKMREFLKHVKLTVCNSLSIYKYLSHNGVNTRRMKVIGSDTLTLRRKVPPKRVKAPGVGAAADLKKDPIDKKFRILFSGTLYQGEGLSALLNVAQKLQNKQPEIEFIFSGDGNGIEWLKNERARLALHNIKLMPLQPAPNYLTFLETGDVHIALQDNGADKVMGFSAIEQSWAVCRPCIYIGESGSDNAIALKKAGNGAVVEPKDEHKLLKAILLYRLDVDKWFEAHEKAKALNTVYDKKPLEEWLAVIGKMMAS